MSWYDKDKKDDYPQFSWNKVKNTVENDKPSMNVYDAAIKKWGIMAQIDMMVEECAELIHAIQKMKRSPLKSGYNNASVLEEFADVEIMLEQMRYIFISWDSIKAEKLIRLRQRIDEQGGIGR